jgi:hypothetical protein
MLLQACIPVVDSREELLSDDNRAQLQLGSTTRDEIYAIFGQPIFMTEDGVSVLYAETRRKWIVLNDGARPGAGDVEINLYLEFNDQNTLSHSELVDFVDRKACAKTGICMFRPNVTKHTFFVVFARPTNEDFEAKQLDQLPGYCSIYLYGNVSFEKPDRGSAWHHVCLDGEPGAAALYSPDLYLRWHLRPGSHRISVQNAWAWNSGAGPYARLHSGFINRTESDWKSLTYEVDCRAGDVHFLRIREAVESKKVEKEDRADWMFSTKYVSTEFGLESVGTEIGQAIIRDRDLALDLVDVNLEPDADTYSIRELVSNCATFGE